MRARWSPAWFLLATVLAACAASPPAASPGAPSAVPNMPAQQQPTAGAPAGQPPPAAYQAGPQGYPHPAATYAVPPGAPTATATISPSAPDRDSMHELAGALFVFESSAREVELSLSSCEAACRALGSMERAARQVCDLARADELPRCQDARGRLREARARVKAACRSCAGGPSLEPDTP
jgi:glucose/arabinose dehydrogenase